MNLQNKKVAWLVTATGALAIAVAVFWIWRGKTPEHLERPPIVVQETPKAKIEEALMDASLLGLIRNARVATRKGDEVTRTAMVNGLKREPARAKTLIQREITKSKDATDQAILTRIGSEIP